MCLNSPLITVAQRPALAMLKMWSAAVVLGSAIFLSPCLVYGSRPIESSDENLKSMQNLARSVESAIDDHRADMEKYTHRETKIVKDLSHTNRKLNLERLELLKLQRQMTLLKDKIMAGEALLKRLQGEITSAQDYASRRLTALYKLNTAGALPILAMSDSMMAFFQNKASLKHIIAADEKVLVTYFQEKARFSAQLDLQKKRSLEMDRLAAAIKDRIGEMAVTKKNRSRLLARVRNEKRTKIKALEALTRAAEQLERRILKRTPPLKTGSPKRPAGLPFGKLKGLLKRPVNGKVISRFGPYRDTKFNVDSFRSGINIKAERGEPILAVYFGEVVFSGWLNGYGNMIIIQHNDHFHTVYAHLEELFKVKGDNIDSGEVIGTVGETDTLTGAGLYFEVRHHGKPINPVEWIKGEIS